MPAAWMPAIVVIVVVGARCAHGLIRLAIEIDVVGRSAVLDCEESTVCAPRLIVGIVVPRVRPPGPARTRREIDRSSRIARNTEYLEPKRGRENRRKVSRLRDRKSTRLNSSHPSISYAVFCLKKKKKKK